MNKNIECETCGYFYQGVNAPLCEHNSFYEMIPLEEDMYGKLIPHKKCRRIKERKNRKICPTCGQEIKK